MDSVIGAVKNQFAEIIYGIQAILGQQNWIAMLGIIIGTLLIERLTLFIFGRLQKLSKVTSTDLDDKILAKSSRPIANFVLLFGLYIIVSLLVLPQEKLAFRTTLHIAIKVSFVFNILWLFWRLTDVLGLYLISKVVKTSSSLDDQLVPILKKSLKIFIAVVGGIYIIQTMGYSISGIVAGLGIGGLAVAMAAKDTLANFFGSVMIFTDSPFRVGDWIKVGSDEGVVEEIGFRSTRIRTFPKTLISVPNSLIANDSINNYSRMPKRRVKMTVGVTYDTTASQMETLVEKIKNLLKNHSEVSQDFYLVNFTDFNSSSLDVLVYYFTVTTEWKEHLRVRQEINLSIMKIVESIGLSMAFPTQTVHIVNDDMPE